MYASVQDLKANTQARVANILELELTYLQNELNTISTQAALLGGAAFAAICTNQKDSFRDPTSQLNFEEDYQFGYEDVYHKYWIKIMLLPVLMNFAASVTVVLSALTVCSAMFLNLWGANDALRTKTISALTKVINSIRTERIQTLRLFTVSVVTFLLTGIFECWLMWSDIGAIIASSVFTIGLFWLYKTYFRIKSLFCHTPPLFERIDPKLHQFLNFGSDGLGAQVGALDGHSNAPETFVSLSMPRASQFTGLTTAREESFLQSMNNNEVDIETGSDSTRRGRWTVKKLFRGRGQMLSEQSTEPDDAILPRVATRGEGSLDCVDSISLDIELGLEGSPTNETSRTKKDTTGLNQTLI